MAEMSSDTRSSPTSEIGELREEFKKGGFDGLEKFAKSKLENWKKDEIDIAITGNSGVGKSTFINAFLDLDDDDEEAAPTGVTETTSEIKSYKDKNNPKITFWDLPGVGTHNFPQKSYFEDVGFDKYDIFILITANRLTENDEWIADELQKKGKVYFLVRSKVWNDVQNSNRRKKEKVPEEDVISKIRTHCKSQYSGRRFYLIDCFYTENDLLDFEKLRQDISDGLPDRKREALIWSFHALAPNLIKQKEEMLRKRIFYEAIGSGAVAMIPVPGPSLAYDVGVLMRLRSKFAKELGLSGGFFKNLFRSSTSASSYALTEKFAEICMQECLEEAVKRVAVNEVTEAASKFLPVFGSIVSAPLSFYGTYNAAHAMLDRMVVDVLKINEMIGEQIASELGVPYRRESSV